MRGAGKGFWESTSPEAAAAEQPACPVLTAAYSRAAAHPANPAPAQRLEGRKLGLSAGTDLAGLTWRRVWVLGGL